MCVYSVNKFKYYNILSLLCVNVLMKLIALIGFFLILFVYAFLHYVNISLNWNYRLVSIRLLMFLFLK